MTDEVLYELRGKVAWITINRPDARNALNTAVRDGLFDAFHRFNADDDAWVAVLTAAGEKAFSAGGDLKEMSDNATKVPPPDFIPQFGRNIQSEKPIIAAVNGLAFAGGFLLVQNCDIVIAADTASFGIAEAKVGRGAPWAAPLPWMLPPKVALQMLMTGDPISAKRAYELGLVNEVVPLAELVERTQAIAERIAANAPLSVRAAKKTVYLMRELPLAEAYVEAERIWEPVYLSEDAQEGPLSFKEKRAPEWKGR